MQTRRSTLLYPMCARESQTGDMEATWCWSYLSSWLNIIGLFTIPIINLLHFLTGRLKWAEGYNTCNSQCNTLTAASAQLHQLVYSSGSQLIQNVSSVCAANRSCERYLQWRNATGLPSRFLSDFAVRCVHTTLRYYKIYNLHFRVAIGFSSFGWLTIMMQLEGWG